MEASKTLCCAYAALSKIKFIFLFTIKFQDLFHLRYRLQRDMGENKVDEGREENMAAWLIAVKTIRIQPYYLRPLGLFYSLFLSFCKLMYPEKEKERNFLFLFLFYGKKKEKKNLCLEMLNP